MQPKIWIACLVFALLVSACGSSSTTSTAASSTATATTAPAPTPTVSPALIAQCFGALGYTVKPAQVVQSGDILILQGGLGGLTYPSYQLPASASSNTPLAIPNYGNSSYYAADFGKAQVNPTITQEIFGSYDFQVCNSSASQSHVLQAVSVKFASVTAPAGQINTWNMCDPVLTSHHMVTGGGCGGAKAGCECFHATFPANTPVGTELAVKQTGNDLDTPGDGKGTLPLTLAPNEVVGLDVGLDQPTPAGLYAFQFGVKIDSSPAVYGPASDPVLFDTGAKAWNGQNCQTAAFLAQITATNPESYYICA